MIFCTNSNVFNQHSLPSYERPRILLLYCPCFYCLFISVLSLDIPLFIKRVIRIPLNGLSQPHFCSRPKQGPRFSNAIFLVLFVLNDSRREETVRFVYIYLQVYNKTIMD